MTKHLILSFLSGFVFCTAPLVSQPILNWQLHAPNGTKAVQTKTGSVELVDTSAEGTPSADYVLSEAITEGELYWRSRHLMGSESFSVGFYGKGSKSKEWDVSVYAAPQVGVHIRRGSNLRVEASVNTGRQFFEDNKWTSYRLVFDTKAERAQLYLNDGNAPVAEVADFKIPIGRVELTAGYRRGVFHGAEFADFKIERKPVSFVKVEEFKTPPAWTALPDAPAEWVVHDKFQQFANWWPGPTGAQGDAAREALKTAMHREALGLGNEFSDALRIVPALANSVHWSEPYKGAQASHLYRSSPPKLAAWDKPSNTRLMEPIYLLAQFYSLNQPWNPYHRDPALEKRLYSALEYWMSLQSKDGGFPEYAGIGASELPAVSFGLDAMTAIYTVLRDEPSFAEMSARWLESMRRAARWASGPNSQVRKQGETYANQYLGVIVGVWHLHRFTGEPEWLPLYNELTDWWIAKAQEPGWFREHAGREDFSYSQVSEFFIDRLAHETGDVRWDESLRRAYASSQLIVGFEMDREVAVIDSCAYTRTSATTLNASGLGGGSTNPASRGPQPCQRTVGRYNRAASRYWEATAFAIGALSPELVEQRSQAFFSKMPNSLKTRSPHSIYHPHAGYWWDGTGDYWAVPKNGQKNAASKTRIWKEERFSEKINYTRDAQELVGIRRPGYYVTLHAGEVHGGQNKGVGLIWIPGFGNALVSSNKTGRPAFGWQPTGADLADSQKSLRLDWDVSDFEHVTSVMLFGVRQPPVRLQLADETISIIAELSDSRTLHLPFVVRDGDQWANEMGKVLVAGLDENAPAESLKSVRIQRSGTDVTHDLKINFSEPVVLTAYKKSPLGGGLFSCGIKVSRQAHASVSAPPKTLEISLTRIVR